MIEAFAKNNLAPRISRLEPENYDRGAGMKDSSACS
jgi:hypothetical protein